MICLGYKGYVIKEYFANYFLHMSRRDLRPARTTDGGPPAPTPSPGGSRWSTPATTTMTGGRLKRVARLRRRRDLLLDLRRRRRRRRHRRADRVPPRPRQARDGHRGPAAGPLRRAGASTASRVTSFRRSRAATAAGSTAASSCSIAQVLDYIEGDATRLGARAAGAPRPRGPAARLRAHRLLAADGHAARQEIAARTCGQAGAVEGRGKMT